MNLAEASAAYYTLVSALSRRARKRALAIWTQLETENVVGSWDRIARDALMAEVSISQRMAAIAAARFMGNALAAQGGTWLGEQVNPMALVGVASDGRDLDSLLFQPAISTMRRLKDYVDVEETMRMGAAQLDAIVGTQVADAARSAMQVEMTTQPAVTGWVRMLSPPACGRCAILAGRFYRFSDGFERHPNCQCQHIPSVEDAADDLRTDPTAYFESLSEAEQNKYFGKGSAQAIREGADMNQVINARRRAAGLSRVGGVETTTEGTTRRGVAGRRLILAEGGDPTQRGATAKAPRLTPDAIIQLAEGDRDRARKLLERNGYTL